MTEYTNVIMYAEDSITCLLASQDVFNQLFHWCSDNKMTINISKTKHMFVPCKVEHQEMIKSNSITVNTEKLFNIWVST